VAEKDSVHCERQVRQLSFEEGTTPTQPSQETSS
jgi:hypothetical protein